MKIQVPYIDAERTWLKTWEPTEWLCPKCGAKEVWEDAHDAHLVACYYCGASQYVCAACRSSFSANMEGPDAPVEILMAIADAHAKGLIEPNA